MPCRFFFQAEDGIRDLTVTGVQTCALPICANRRAPDRGGHQGGRHGALRREVRRHRPRSEERRVGKECRSRWSPYKQKKKNSITTWRTYHDFIVESGSTLDSVSSCRCLD